jgi:hypothetical protein
LELTHNPKQLLVEGQDDLFAVAGLMRAHVDWPEGPGSKHTAPVFIHAGNGADEILRKDGLLAVFLKGSDLKSGGVVLDADGAASGKYDRVRSICLDMFPAFPKELPINGVVVENQNQLRFGVWIMPDNSSDGYLETFLQYLVPAPRNPAWDHAEQSVKTAREMGCTCHDCHVEQANLYTWLAWQEPPGQSFGIALTKKILDPQSSYATSFVSWFMNLYQLPPKSKLFN